MLKVKTRLQGRVFLVYGIVFERITILHIAIMFR